MAWAPIKGKKLELQYRRRKIKGGPFHKYVIKKCLKTPKMRKKCGLWYFLEVASPDWTTNKVCPLSEHHKILSFPQASPEHKFCHFPSAGPNFKGICVDGLAEYSY